MTFRQNTRSKGPRERMLLRRSIVSKYAMRRTGSLNCQSTPEVLHEEGGRQPPVHFNRVVLAGPCPFYDVGREIGTQDLNVPVVQRGLQEEHGQTVGFLARRCRGRPEPQLLRIPPLFLHAGQEDSPYGLIMGGIAEKV